MGSRREIIMGSNRDKIIISGSNREKIIMGRIREKIIIIITGSNREKIIIITGSNREIMSSRGEIMGSNSEQRLKKSDD